MSDKPHVEVATVGHIDWTPSKPEPTAWTSTPPSEPGWYWMRQHKTEVEFCLIHDDGGAWSMGEAYMSDAFMKTVNAEFWPVRIPEPPR